MKKESNTKSQSIFDMTFSLFCQTGQEFVGMIDIARHFIQDHVTFLYYIRGLKCLKIQNAASFSWISSSS